MTRDLALRNLSTRSGEPEAFLDTYFERFERSARDEFARNEPFCTCDYWIMEVRRRSSADRGEVEPCLRECLALFAG